MRILVTVPWRERRGGAEAMLQTILDGGERSEHELELVFLEPGPWPSELIAAGMPVEVLDAGRVRQLPRLVATVLRLASIFRRRRPDLILNWAAKTQLYAAPAAVLAGCSDRVLWWQHALATRHWLDRSATALPSLAVGCCSSASARAQAELWPHRTTFTVAPGVAPPSSAEGAPVELAGDAPVVGIVGRLQPWKGQDRLLEAIAILRERGRRARLLIVGGDSYGLSPEYAESLPALITRLGLDGEVTLSGEVPDAAPFIAAMDILVNASDPEPFGIVLLEAMAAGVPVVAVDSGGPPDVIEHRRNGMLARSGAPQDLAAALEPLLDSAELRRTIGHAGRERFTREYTDVAFRERFYAALDQFAGTGSSARSKPSARSTVAGERKGR